MINRRRSGVRGTPAKVNANAGLAASEGVNSGSISDGSHESVYLGPFYVTPSIWPLLPPIARHPAEASFSRPILPQRIYLIPITWPSWPRRSKRLTASAVGVGVICEQLCAVAPLRRGS